jgi:hypothetical protein
VFSFCNAKELLDGKIRNTGLVFGQFLDLAFKVEARGIFWTGNFGYNLAFRH